MRKLKLASLAAALVLAVGLGGCGSIPKSVQDNKAGVTGAVVTGVVVNAAGCGFSWPWCAVRTAAGAVAGWFGGKAIANEK